MPKKRYEVQLSDAQRAQLLDTIRAGSSTAHANTHARILLKADTSPDGPAWTDQMIASTFEIGLSTVARVRQSFVEDGLTAALQRKPTSRLYERALDGAAEAHLIALACSTPPEGAARWTLRLLAERLVALEYVPSVSHETVRQTLKKTNSNRGE